MATHDHRDLVPGIRCLLAENVSISFTAHRRVCACIRSAFLSACFIVCDVRVPGDEADPADQESEAPSYVGAERTPQAMPIGPLRWRICGSSDVTARGPGAAQNHAKTGASR
jgi:hypothetical protein